MGVTAVGVSGTKKKELKPLCHILDC
jgi:hypothetical protein